MQTATKIAEIMSDLNLMWKIGGVRKVPTPEDVQAVLDRGQTEASLADINKDEVVHVVMTHLIFRREDGTTRVYLDMGEL